ncbi:Translation initiation factor IF-3 [Sebaldella termitidis]|nr:Translation initiation factor IF-3 [Sebaldella termitidis]
MNEGIRAREVRVVSDDGEQYGVLTLKEALEKAQEAGMDLVEISPNANPPVCKIMDYGKFKYEKTKKDKENKKKQKQVVTKEMRVKPHIDTHDRDTKIAQIEKFLEKEYKIKISLRLAGRQKLYADQGIKVLDELADHFKDKAIIEKKYGKDQIQKFVLLSPKK